MGTTAVRLDLSNPLMPLVEVAGVDVSPYIAKAAIEAQPHAAPVLHLSLVSNLPDEVATEAEVVAYTDAGPSPREWLDMIDPAKLEQTVLNAHRPGATVGQIVLETLKGWADGD